jgi:hypothetical protein
MKGGNILISVHTEDGAERTRVKEIFKKPTRLRQPKTLRIVRTPPPCACVDFGESRIQRVKDPALPDCGRAV